MSLQSLNSSKIKLARARTIMIQRKIINTNTYNIKTLGKFSYNINKKLKINQ